MRTVSGFGRQVGQAGVAVRAAAVERRWRGSASRRSATVDRRPLLTDRLGAAAPRRRRARPGRRHDVRQRRARRARRVGGPGRELQPRLEAPAAGQPLVGAGLRRRATTPGRSRCTARPTGSGRRRWAPRRGGWCGGCATTRPAAGPYRVRLVDDTSAGGPHRRHRGRRRRAGRRAAGAAARRGVRAAALRARAARERRRLAGLRADERRRCGWWTLDAACARSAARAVLGFDRLHAVLLPS